MAELTNQDTLVMVFTVFRHGARAPLLFHPDDPNKDHWVDGIGNLTNEGKGQAYSLGEKYRQRYDGFLGPKYVSKDLYVYSTDSDRCIMTAQCCLAAIYPPIGQNKWHPTLQWQPIPVHTTPEALDPLGINTAIMAKTVDIPEYSYVSEKHKKMYKTYVENQRIWDMWRNFTSKEDGRSSFFEIYTAMDTAAIEMKSNLPYKIPECDVDFSVSCSIIIEGVKLLLETLPYYVKQGAAFLSIIFNRIKGHIEGRTKTKMFMYSVHDQTIYCLIAQMGLDSESIKLCGDLTFELHKFKDNQYYIRCLYCGSLDSEPVDLQLNGHQIFHPIEEFEILVEKAQLRTENMSNCL